MPEQKKKAVQEIHFHSVSHTASVRPEGFEPSTLGAEIRYSIQLNYGRNS